MIIINKVFITPMDITNFKLGKNYVISLENVRAGQGGGKSGRVGAGKVVG